MRVPTGDNCEEKRGPGEFVFQESSSSYISSRMAFPHDQNIKQRPTGVHMDAYGSLE